MPFSIEKGIYIDIFDVCEATQKQRNSQAKINDRTVYFSWLRFLSKCVAFAWLFAFFFLLSSFGASTRPNTQNLRSREGKKRMMKFTRAQTRAQSTFVHTRVSFRPCSEGAVAVSAAGGASHFSMISFALLFLLLLWAHCIPERLDDWRKCSAHALWPVWMPENCVSARALWQEKSEWRKCLFLCCEVTASWSAARTTHVSYAALMHTDTCPKAIWHRNRMENQSRFSVMAGAQSLSYCMWNGLLYLDIWQAMRARYSHSSISHIRQQ